MTANPLINDRVESYLASPNHCRARRPIRHRAPGARSRSRDPGGPGPRRSPSRPLTRRRPRTRRPSLPRSRSDCPAGRRSNLNAPAAPSSPEPASAISTWSNLVRVSPRKPSRIPIQKPGPPDTAPPPWPPRPTTRPTPSDRCQSWNGSPQFERVEGADEAAVLRPSRPIVGFHPHSGGILDVPQIDRHRDLGDRIHSR